MDRKTHVALLCLSLCFAAGAALGQVLAFGASDAAALEIRDSLRGYASPPLTLSLVLSTLLTWFRAPALAFLLGFTSLGVPLVGLTAAAFGFLLSFSAGCFASAFGWKGVLLSAAALGIRAFVTLPCFFALSLSSIERAAWLFRLSSGRAPRPYSRPNSHTRRLCALVCTLILLCGAGLDLACTPRLLRLVLGWMSAGSGTGP